MRTWIVDNEAVFWWIMISSLGTLAAAVILVPFLIIRIPADYFTSRRRPSPEWRRWPVLQVIFLVIKNVLGYAFIVAGLIMLVTPGQGILTLVIGSSLADYPASSASSAGSSGVAG